MEIVIFILALIIFLFTLYKLVKDDHVFLRRNIKPEQFFDITFFVVIMGLIFTKALSLNHGFSVTFFVFGSATCLYMIGKYKKLSLSRLFDFFTLSFMTALPVGYALIIIVSKQQQKIISAISAVVYLGLAVFFIKFLLANVMSRKLREGMISIYFIMFFSIFTFVMNIVPIKKNMNLLNIENIILFLFFLLGVIRIFLTSNKRSISSS